MSQIELDEDLKEAAQLIEYAARSKFLCITELEQLTQQASTNKEAGKIISERIAETERKLKQASHNFEYSVINILRVHDGVHQ